MGSGRRRHSHRAKCRCKDGGGTDDSFPHITASAEVEMKPICGVLLFCIYMPVHSFRSVCLQPALSVALQNSFSLFWIVCLVSGISCPFPRTFFLYNRDSCFSHSETLRLKTSERKRWFRGGGAEGGLGAAHPLMWSVTIAGGVSEHPHPQQDTTHG